MRVPLFLGPPAHRALVRQAPLRARGEGSPDLWWATTYPYKGRTVRAFYAAGNGGQIVMGIPELDLVIAFYGGNYSQPVAQLAQRVYVPEFILSAVN